MSWFSPYTIFLLVEKFIYVLFLYVAFFFTRRNFHICLFSIQKIYPKREIFGPFFYGLAYFSCFFKWFFLHTRECTPQVKNLWFFLPEESFFLYREKAAFVRVFSIPICIIFLSWNIFFLYREMFPRIFCLTKDFSV